MYFTIAHYNFYTGANNKQKKAQRVFTYDRDIVCLPKSALESDGLVRIPRKKEVLAINIT